MAGKVLGRDLGLPLGSDRDGVPARALGVRSCRSGGATPRTRVQSRTDDDWRRGQRERFTCEVGCVYARGQVRPLCFWRFVIECVWRLALEERCFIAIGTTGVTYATAAGTTVESADSVSG